MTNNKETKILIPVDGKNYTVFIKDTNKTLEWEKLVFIECKSAGFSCEYPASDLPALLQDIEHLIRDELTLQKDTQINIRVKAKDKVLLQQLAYKWWFKSLTDYILTKSLQYN